MQVDPVGLVHGYVMVCLGFRLRKYFRPLVGLNLRLCLSYPSLNSVKLSCTTFQSGNISGGILLVGPPVQLFDPFVLRFSLTYHVSSS